MSRQAWLYLAALLLGACYGVYTLWTRGLPWLLSSAVGLVPVEWETRLGQAYLDSIREPLRPCLQEEKTRLERALGASAYRYDVRCVESREVNAFAAPGGVVVLHGGLLAEMRDGDEAAAVLAHEMSHVERRHALRAVVRSFALYATFALLIGDVSSLAAQMAGGLSSLHYQRGDEEQADREGVALLRRAGYDPRAMARMLESLQAATREEAQPPAFISSHPDMEVRIRQAREAAR